MSERKNIIIFTNSIYTCSYQLGISKLLITHNGITSSILPPQGTTSSILPPQLRINEQKKKIHINSK